MSGTVKTVLIVGGVAAGVVVLFKMLQPSPLSTKKAPTANTDLVAISNIVGGLKGLLGGSDSGGRYTTAAQINADASLNGANFSTPGLEDVGKPGYGADYSTSDFLSTAGGGL